MHLVSEGAWGSLPQVPELKTQDFFFFVLRYKENLLAVTRMANTQTLVQTQTQDTPAPPSTFPPLPTHTHMHNTSDLGTGTHVASVSGAWGYKVSVGTGCPSVSKL